MRSYCSCLANILHFAGRARQRGSGFGSLALGVGRVALPFANKTYFTCCSISRKGVVRPEFARINGCCYHEEIL